MIDTVSDADLVGNVPPSQRSHLPPWHGRRSLADLRTDGPYTQTAKAVRLARKWVRQLRTGPRPQRGLLLHGPVGTGKTTVAAAMAADLGEPDRCCYRDLRRVYAQAKAEMDTADAGREVERLVRAPLLVLDDVGKQRATPWAVEVLRDVVERRHDGGGLTVATTNLSLDDLATLLGPAAWSRLHSGTVAVRVDGDDLRKA